MNNKHLICLLGILLLVCCDTGSSHLINLNAVSRIEIRKHTDSVSLQLSDQQAYYFLKKWNKSELKGSHTIHPEYHVNIYLDNDSLIRLMTHQHLIAHSNDFIYSFGDKGFFRRIWYDQAGIPHDFQEYTPVVRNKQGFEKAHHVLTDKHKEGIKKVLTHYNHHWKDVRGQIFYKGRLEEKLLWDYTLKAEDSTWLAGVDLKKSSE